MTGGKTFVDSLEASNGILIEGVITVPRPIDTIVRDTVTGNLYASTHATVATYLQLTGQLISQGLAVYVDGTKAAAGDGSLTAPYNTLPAGIAASSAGQVVLVFPGTYTLTADLDLTATTSLIGVGGARRTLLVAGDANFTRVGIFNDCLVQGISIDHSGALGRGYDFRGTRAMLRDCISDVSGTFGDPDYAVAETISSGGNNQIRGLTVKGTYDLVGVTLSGGTANGLNIDGIWFEGFTAPDALALEQAGTVAYLANMVCIENSNVITSCIRVAVSTALYATDCQLGFASGQDIHVLGDLNASGLITLGNGPSEAILLDGAGCFAQLAGVMYTDIGEIAVTNGADHNNFILGPGPSAGSTVANGAATKVVNFSQAFDGKPVTATLGEVDGVIHVLSAVWNGTGGVTVTLSAVTTDVRTIYVSCNSMGYGV